MNRKEFIFKIGTIILVLNFTKKIFAEEVNKSMDRELRFVNLDEALKEIKLLESKRIKISGEWNLSQVASHLAQSIEYSMNGFPELKNAIFRFTVGKIAFSVFSSKGYMSHDLNAPIPGATELDKDIDVKLSFQRLYKAIDDFKNFQSELKPHFAYGNLTKSEYEKAHAMHIANHLSFIQVS